MRDVKRLNLSRTHEKSAILIPWKPCPERLSAPEGLVMNLRTRLQRLERAIPQQRPPEPERSQAECWLGILRLVEPFMAEHTTDRLDQHRQAIALLAEYVA